MGKVVYTYPADDVAGAGNVWTVTVSLAAVVTADYYFS